MKVSIFISTAVALFMSSGLLLYAQKNSYSHEISAYGRSSYILPTSGYFCGSNPTGMPLTQSMSGHLEYTFSYPSGSLYHSYQGIGAGIHSFGSHQHIGTPLSLYFVQGASLAKMGSWATLDYRWNLGLSYGWQNKESKLTSTKTNAYLSIGMYLSLYAGRHFKLSVGPEFAHYSNGDTKFPNGGTNTIGLRAGMSVRTGNRERLPETDRLLRKEESFSKRMSYDLTFHGAWRADRNIIDNRIYVINRKFPVCGITFNPLYHFNRYVSLGPSLDFIYDSSADLVPQINGQKEMTGYDQPQWWKQMAPGISLRTEFRMAFVAVNAGYGYSFCHKGSELDVTYFIFNMKTFMSDRFYLNVGYRLNSKISTHCLMFGLGWSL